MTGQERSREALALERRLLRKAGRAVGDYGMIAEGDRVLVALSGGKDSWAMLGLLELLRRRAPVKFDLVAVTVHPGYPDYDPSPVEAACRELGLAHFTEPSNMVEIIEAKRAPGSSFCSICSRLRRGILYGIAQREGFSKIALGHHADDLIETFLMAAFFTGEIKSMSPRLVADDGRNVVIRPLAYCAEDDLAAYAEERGFPVVSCGCVLASCVHTERQRMKRLLREMEAERPGVKANLLSCLGRVRTRHLFKPHEEIEAARGRTTS